jgi:hypothetical protein
MERIAFWREGGWRFGGGFFLVLPERAASKLAGYTGFLNRFLEVFIGG